MSLTALKKIVGNFPLLSTTTGLTFPFNEWLILRPGPIDSFASMHQHLPLSVLKKNEKFPSDVHFSSSGGNFCLFVPLTHVWLWLRSFPMYSQTKSSFSIGPNVKVPSPLSPAGFTSSCSGRTLGFPSDSRNFLDRNLKRRKLTIYTCGKFPWWSQLQVCRTHPFQSEKCHNSEI